MVVEARNEGSATLPEKLGFRLNTFLQTSENNKLSGNRGLLFLALFDNEF